MKEAISKLRRGFKPALKPTAKSDVIKSSAEQGIGLFVDEHIPESDSRSLSRCSILLRKMKAPEPHPLDFDWRFTPKTARQLADLIAVYQSCLCVGAPTVALLLEN